MKIVLILSMGILFSGCTTAENNFEYPISDNTIENSEVPIISTNFKENYLLEVNKARSVQQSCGSKGTFESAKALTWNDSLYESAYEHSVDLSTTNTFSHLGSGEESDITGAKLGKKSTFKERIEAQGYTHYSAIGENVGAGTDTDSAKKVVAQLMESDGHCANIMNPEYAELGMAMSKNANADYVYYWTQNFGTAR
jgi:uncharacterized protein YkwD